MDAARNVVTFSELDPARAERLTVVFNRYDSNKDGYLELVDMRILGWALSGRRRVPTDAESALQLQRADVDGDGRLSLLEWLRYGIVLSRLPEYEFQKLMLLLETSYVEGAALGLTSYIAS